MNRSERRRRTRIVLANRRKVLEYTGLLLGDQVICTGVVKHLTDHEWKKKCEGQVGRCRKRKPLDCGKTRCWICSRGRWAHGLSHHDLKWELSATEQVNELYNGV